MKNFKTIYAFEVFDRICEGEYVGAVDRESKTVYDVRNLSVQALANMLHHTDADNRYSFWIEEETDGEL